MKTATQDSATPRKAYDPGQPAGIQVLNFHQGLFLVKPFRRADGQQKDGEYQVDLCEGSCTCPHHCYRIAPKLEAGEEVEMCKHYQAAREESYKIALHVSRQLSAVNLRKQLLRSDLRSEITEALQAENWSRLMGRKASALPLSSLQECVNRSALQLTAAR